MINVVRLYLEPRTEIPEHQLPPHYPKVVDVLPHEVRKTRRPLKKAGFEVFAVPI